MYGSDTIFWVVSDLTDNSLIEINLLDVQDIYANINELVKTTHYDVC